MTSSLSEEQRNRMLPLLGGIARMVAQHGEVTPADLELLLLGADMEGTPEIEQELLRWARILSRARGTDSLSSQQAVLEALMLRGIPEGPAKLAIAAVAGIPGGRAHGRDDIQTSITQLDFGLLSPGERAEQVFEVQGTDGRISTENDHIEVTPSEFGPEWTRIQVRVKPVTGGMLYSTIQLSNVHETIEIPVIAQWELPQAAASVPPDSVPQAAPTMTPAVAGRPPQEQSAQRTVGSAVAGTGSRPIPPKAMPTRTSMLRKPPLALLALVPLVLALGLAAHSTGLVGGQAPPTATPTATSTPRPTATPLPTATPRPTATPKPAGLRAVYQTNFSTGTAGWNSVGSGTWSQENDVLNYDGQGYSILVAPVRPPSAVNFAVQATIRFQQDMGGDPNGFGLLIRTVGTPDAASPDGIEAGVAQDSDGSVHSEIWYGSTQGEAGRGDGTSAVPIDRSSLNLDNGWHTYRLEVRGSHMILRIDGQITLQTSSSQFLSNDRIGLFADGDQIEVQDFRLLSLQ